MRSSIRGSLRSEVKVVAKIILNLFEQNLTRKQYLDAVTSEIAGWTDCRCVGIRVSDSEGYIPYESCIGFSPQFLEKENRLSINDDVCACIRVIKGEFDLSDQSARTPNGSFCCENAALFVAGLSEEQKSLFRGTCVETGFKSICIVPIRYRNNILGAIHLADERVSMISMDAAESIESVSPIIGEALLRFRLEKALHDSENRYRNLVENSPCGIYLVQDGKFIFANEAFADIHGYSINEIIGVDSLSIIHAEDRHLVQEIRRKRLEGAKTPNEYEVQGIKKNGGLIWIQRRNVLIDYHGKQSILGYEVDITERKNNERILLENHELLETIFSNVHFLVAYMDRDFNFIRVNRAYGEADGHSPDFFIGKNHFTLFPNDENERIFRKVVETGKPYFVYAKPFEYVSSPERGTTYWDWSLQAVKDASNTVCGVVLSLVNVTERKRAEEALKKANAELSQRADQLSRLTSELTLSEQRERRRIAEILHDHLQQLMVGARMSQEALIRNIDNALKPEAEHVLDLIGKLIDTSRSLTAELSPPILHYGDLTASLKWLARWMQKNQGFEVKLQTETRINLNKIDLTVLLFQSIRELLLNVLKHACVKSATVKMEQENGELRISIRDQGVGFDPEAVLRSAGSEPKFGLICIRERLMHLGGRLELESRPNSGSSTTLIVPIDDRRSTEADLKDFRWETLRKPVLMLPDKQVLTDKIRVMLVDDHSIMREGLSSMLGLQPDIEVVGEASNGEEAVHLAREIIPDVILMDVNMPKMNGLEATRIIHSEFPHIRIIGLSMYDADEHATAMFHAGASAYRSKSENTELLLATIRGE